MKTVLLYFQVGDEYLVVVQRSLVNYKYPFGKSLGVFEEKKVFILDAVEYRDDALDFFLELPLLHLDPKLSVSVDRQQLFKWDCGFSSHEGLLHSIFVVGNEVTDQANSLQDHQQLVILSDYFLHKVAVVYDRLFHREVNLRIIDETFHLLEDILFELFFEALQGLGQFQVEIDDEPESFCLSLPQYVLEAVGRAQKNGFIVGDEFFRELSANESIRRYYKASFSYLFLVEIQAIDLNKVFAGT